MSLIDYTDRIGVGTQIVVLSVVSDHTSDLSSTTPVIHGIPLIEVLSSRSVYIPPPLVSYRSVPHLRATDEPYPLISPVPRSK